MKLGVIYPQIEMNGDPEAVRRFALAAEELGYDHLIAYDHVLGAEHAGREPPLTGPYSDAHPFHDAFTMFSYLAGLTSRIEFVPGVLILPQRQTALVAKQAADLALFSKDRLRLGVGIGWNHVEYEALGQDFHTRGKRIEEQVPLLRRLWTERLVTHHGRFEHVERASLTVFPKKPISIWFGGFSEPAFKRAGRMGDGFLYGGPLDRVIEAWSITRRAIQEAGRDEAQFGREFMHVRVTDPQDIADTMNQWRDAGGTHFSLSTMNGNLGPVDAHIEYIDQVRRKLG